MAAYDIGGSPAPEGVGDIDSKKISFRFCRECSNMLYPKEDRENSTLMFACRTCQFSEPAGASCIYRNSLKETIAETPGNVQDVAQDPTVGQHRQEQQWQRPSSDGDEDMDSGDDDGQDTPGSLEGESMDVVDDIPDLCTFCGQEILCPFCDRPTDRGVMLEAVDPEVVAVQRGEDAVQLEQRERALSGAGQTSRA